MVLTGTGQGLPSDADWATAYLGPGPWGSLVPALPSVPSQAYEGIATLAILAILTVAVLLGAFRRRDGRLFFVAIGLWAVVRAVVSTTWRDPVVAGGLNAGGLIAVGIAIGCAVAPRDPRPSAPARTPPPTRRSTGRPTALARSASRHDRPEPRPGRPVRRFEEYRDDSNATRSIR